MVEACIKKVYLKTSPLSLRGIEGVTLREGVKDSRVQGVERAGGQEFEKIVNSKN